jgi:DNA-binding NtrC family response regulator
MTTPLPLPRRARFLYAFGRFLGCQQPDGPRVILILDTDPASRRRLGPLLDRAGVAHRFADAARPDPAQRADLVVAAIGARGFEPLRRLREAVGDLPLLALLPQSGPPEQDAVRAGADAAAREPLTPRALVEAVRRAMAGPAREARDPERGDPFAALVAAGAATRAAVALARRAAGSDIPVLFEGETGVGKEAFARAVHAASRRSGGPFVAVNCGALPEGLVESTLFGHERGAFTGAVERRPGRFVEAEGGVLFLDEIGELPLAAQTALLRALQTREIDAVGGGRPRPVNVRVMSATHRDLAAEVRAGRFREDLFYRIRVFPVPIPPLRARPEDIAPLAERSLRHLADAEGGEPSVLSDAALVALRAAPWPGNVRELENVLHRARVLAPGGRIEPEHLGLGAEVAAPPAAAGGGEPSAHVRPLREVEADHIRAALIRYGGRMSETARRLGIGRSTLYRKIEELGLRADDISAAP